MFQVLNQGQDWLALHKPAGINIHSEDNEAGFVVLASQQLGQPLWPVHRLDKVTSGILLLATSAAGAARLGNLFAAQKIHKVYLAQSGFKPKKKQGWIKGDMEKGRNGSWLLKRSMNNPAITYFTSHYDENLKKRLFILEPQTGKTHQLRVAMKSLGAPIDGDIRYGGIDSDRTYLHAYRLAWEDEPVQEKVCITCPPSSGQWSTELGQALALSTQGSQLTV
ncbi:MAG: TIGR01621 family pseudouridine synthase [Venatoribacter sp.]